MGFPVPPADDDFSDIDRWQRQCEPQQSGQLPGVEALADGSLDCEIVKAELTKTAKTKETIFRVVCRALTGPSAGLVFDRTRFFRTQSGLDWLAGELITLGLPADKWLQSSSFGRELAANASQLHGIRFSAKKSTKKDDDGKDQAQFYVNARLHASTTMPSAAPASATPFDAPPVANDIADVPF